MRRRDERGAATAEAAMAIPTLVLVAVGLCWLVSLGVTQVRVVDAAREAARSLARGDSEQAARELGNRVAPSATFVVKADADSVRVTATEQVDGPNGVLSFTGFTARAETVAAREDVE